MKMGRRRGLLTCLENNQSASAIKFAERVVVGSMDFDVLWLAAVISYGRSSNQQQGQKIVRRIEYQWKRELRALALVLSLTRWEVLQD
jgi:hypothetical protein